MQIPRLSIKSSTYFLHKVLQVPGLSSTSLGNLVQPMKPSTGGMTRSSSMILRLPSISQSSSDIPLPQAICSPLFKPITRLYRSAVPPAATTGRVTRILTHLQMIALPIPHWRCQFFHICIFEHSWTSFQDNSLRDYWMRLSFILCGHRVGGMTVTRLSAWAILTASW
jgi:hypothetical protein